MKIIRLDEILDMLPKINLVKVIEDGFSALSNQQAIIPPIGEMIFDDPPGEVHIKYGHIIDSPYYVVKIASGFYKNPLLNLPSSQGLMLLFNKHTGELISILLDEGYLTNLRTAIAGAIAAKYLAPKHYKSIGIVGAGTQARMQLSYLQEFATSREVMVYHPREDALKAYANEMSNSGYNIKLTPDITELTANCQFIITTTPSTTPILHLDMLLPGTHITAIGSDTPEKTELDPSIIKAADILVTDSIAQANSRGEIYQALKSQAITKEKKLIEIGQIINQQHPGRTNDTQLTVADFAGVAVQDIKIAEAIAHNSHLSYTSN